MQFLFSSLFVKNAVLIISILLLSQIGAYFLRNKAEKNANQILAPISQNSPMEIDGIRKYSNLEKPKLDLTINLFNIIESQKSKHRNAFLTFYPYHFASSTLLLILSSLSVVLLFITTQMGLANASVYVRTTFFYAGMPDSILWIVSCCIQTVG